MRKILYFSALIVCFSAGHLVAGDSQIALPSQSAVTPEDAVAPQAASAPQAQAQVKAAQSPKPTDAVKPAAATAAPVAPVAAPAPTVAIPAPVPADPGKAVRDSLALRESAAFRDSAASAAPTGAVAAPADSAASPVDTAQAQSSKGKKRKSIVRETTVNTIDELKGRYRSPKRALFMSLVVPGLGQAYVGQHWFNYTRGAAYFLADVALAYGWHFYVVEKQDRQIAKYQRFADQHWRQSKYENIVAGLTANQFTELNPHRESYCDAVQQREGEGNKLFIGCRDREKEASGYQGFQLEYTDKDWSDDSVSHRRAQFNNSQAFYELIGKEVEFITGWDDANNIQILDSSIVMVNPDGSVIKDSDGNPREPYSDNQQTYVSMRDRANQYARMQTYFLGGIVLNHIVSALDAALAARFHNKALYQTEVRWYDRVRLESDLAWEGPIPRPTVTASITF